MIDYLKLQKEMVKTQLENRGIKKPEILAAFLEIPRHLFVPLNERELAYADGPIPIGEQQTISQPYVVAYMTQALNIKPSDTILEIGTGSGYQAAILSQLARAVYTIEILETLKTRASKVFKELQLKNIHPRLSDGSFGWEEKGPFDGIMVTAATKELPSQLLKQLKVGGNLIIPMEISSTRQSLRKYHKAPQEEAPGYRLEIIELLPVLFVPMTGVINF